MMCCSYISSANWNEHLIVYSFLIKKFNMENKNVARLYVGANKIDGNGGGSHILVVYVLCKVHT